MKIVNVHEAKSTLSALLIQAEHGQDVVISRNGTPVARLVACNAQPQRERNAWRDLPGWSDFSYDASIFAPMDDEELSGEGWL